MTSPESRHTLKITCVCHTPIPSPTRLADPNRVRGARLYTRTLYFFFFYNRYIYKITTTRVVSIRIYTHILSPIYIYIYNESLLSITYSERRTYCDEPLPVCCPNSMRKFSCNDPYQIIQVFLTHLTKFD